jgi:cytochrome P450
MRIYFDSLGRIDPFDLLNLPDFVPRLGRLRTRAAVRLFHQAVDEMIAMRGRCDLRANGPRHDLLTLMLNARDPESGQPLGDAEIRANVITFMSAGHESTANAIAWTLFLLSQSSTWRERVAAEARRELDGPAETLPDRLVETRAVVEEALRLYPPLAAISRVALGCDELAGTPIGRGAMIVMAPYVLHRHRLWWKEPELFDPAKFLPPARARIDRYVYMPFGAGPRGCIGSVFALQEAVIVVAAIIREFELDVAPGHDVWPLHRITLRPRRGLPMIVRQRVGWAKSPATTRDFVR